MMRDIFSQRKFMAVLLFSSVGVIAFGWGFARLIRGIENTRTGILATKIRIRAIEGEERRSRAISQLLGERQDDLNRVYRTFVDRSQPVAFIEDLENLATTSHIVLLLDLDTSRAREKELAFRLTVDGSSRATDRFLKLLELMPYPLEVEEMSVQRLSGDTKKDAATHRSVLIIRVRTSS